MVLLPEVNPIVSKPRFEISLRAPALRTSPWPDAYLPAFVQTAGLTLVTLD